MTNVTYLDFIGFSLSLSDSCSFNNPLYGAIIVGFLIFRDTSAPRPLCLVENIEIDIKHDDDRFLPNLSHFHLSEISFLVQNLFTIQMNLFRQIQKYSVQYCILCIRLSITYYYTITKTTRNYKNHISTLLELQYSPLKCSFDKHQIPLHSDKNSDSIARII